MGKEINTAANPFFLDNASTTSDGLMSAADKAKLDSLSPSGSTGNFTFVGNTMDLAAPAVMQIGDVTTSAITFDATAGAVSLAVRRCRYDDAVVFEPPAIQGGEFDSQRRYSRHRRGGRQIASRHRSYRRKTTV